MSEPQVFVTRPIVPGPLESLGGLAQIEVNPRDVPLHPAELREKAVGRTALLCHLTDTIDEELLRAAGPQLKIVANYAVGYNNIDLDACRRHNVFVSNTPGVLTESTADIAFGLLLAVARRILEGDRLVRRGEFTGWAPQMLLGREIHGKTLGIVGCGRIGQAMARRARGFGMKVIYAQRHPLPDELHKEIGLEYVPLGRLLEVSDFVSLHCPLTAETRHLLGRNELTKMKREAFLINTARGAVVDEAVLVEFLQKDKIAGAGFDVYENEPAVPLALRALNNVVLLPHIGSATFETRKKMGEMAVANIRAALLGQMPPNVLDV